jgi:hypothetical protein
MKRRALRLLDSSASLGRAFGHVSPTAALRFVHGWVRGRRRRGMERKPEKGGRTAGLSGRVLATGEGRGGPRRLGCRRGIHAVVHSSGLSPSVKRRKTTGEELGWARWAGALGDR